MKKIHITLLVLITSLLATVLVSAQGNGQMGQITAQSVQMELDRTNQVIEQAREMVAASNSVKARYAYEYAVTLQETAVGKFREGTLNGYQQALMLTRQAREKAKYALANGMFTEQNEDVVLRQLEKVGQMLERARDEYGSDMGPNLQTTFESAQDNLRRAWEFYREGHQRPALKLCNQVENTLRKIAGIAQRQRQGAVTFERTYESVGELLNRARIRVADCESESAQQLMVQAQQATQEARRMSEESHPKAAMQTLRNARRLAVQAMKMCGGFEDVAVMYERLVAETDRVADLIPEGNEPAQELLQQVYDQLDLASGYIADGDTEAAVAALKAARLSLRQIKELL